MSNRTFLDVDDTILTQNLTLPETVAQDNLLKQLDSKPFFIVQPKPGICVKTKTDADEKVFLNICTSDKIPAPEDISDAKLIEIISEEKASDFVIPLSIGTERLESDKGGSPCVTCDIVINTTYFEKCQKQKNFLIFTITVIIEGTGAKINKNLNLEEYVILKNRKVMGKLQQFRIENREPRTHTQTKKPLIEEIKSSPKESYKKKNEIKETEISSKSIDSKIDYVLLKQPLKGTATNLIGLFYMPKGINSEDMEVLLNEDRIVINVDKIGLTCDLSIPYTINVASVKCLLDKYLRVLRLDMPVQNATDCV
ncbi:PIH1 domain containing 1 [Nomia melanderi]|uniref:PIH1 domain containing 1 n=1 Tax=Nomia melanderi TaxID=2448451 RepID=UPI00130439F9|nr:PIH1 domain-containing protein 1-like [Nomia melanderi]